MDDGSDEYLLGREEWESIRKVEPDLMTKNRPSPHTRTIHTVDSSIHDLLEEVEILLFCVHS